MSLSGILKGRALKQRAGDSISGMVHIKRDEQSGFFF